jgi:hypothetical protein
MMLVSGHLMVLCIWSHDFQQLGMEKGVSQASSLFGDFTSSAAPSHPPFLNNPDGFSHIQGVRQDFALRAPLWSAIEATAVFV